MSNGIKWEKKEFEEANNNSPKESSRSTKKLIYECGDCLLQFSKKEELVKHVNISHLQLRDLNKFYCDLCPRSFSRKCHLARHQSRLHPTQTFTCDFCKSSFNCKDNLYRHLKALHLIDDNYKCGICGKMFNEISYVKNHILAVHLKEKEEECKICRKVFNTKGDRDKHVRFVHQKIKELKCLLCQRTFALMSTIKKHIRRHFKKPGVIPLENKDVNELIVEIKWNQEENLSED